MCFKNVRNANNNCTLSSRCPLFFPTLHTPKWLCSKYSFSISFPQTGSKIMQNVLFHGRMKLILKPCFNYFHNYLHILYKIWIILKSSIKRTYLEIWCIKIINASFVIFSECGMTVAPLLVFWRCYNDMSRDACMHICVH